MSEHSAATTIGMDLGDKHCQLCVLDSVSRTTLEESRVPTTKAGIERYLAGRSPSRVVMEVGTHSGWISRRLSELGHEVVVADPRRVRALAAAGDDKDDALDAEFLARIGSALPRLRCYRAGSVASRKLLPPRMTAGACHEETGQFGRPRRVASRSR